MRGYYGIGIENGKTEQNLGTLWRTAHILGASFIFTINNRYRMQNSDTSKAWKSIPLFHYQNLSDFLRHTPADLRIIGVELHEEARELETYKHPERSAYILGSEGMGLSEEAINACSDILVLPGDFSMNVATAGSIVMYDRHLKG